jgi:type IV secretory pathway TraG/TraD family ATPase VirD4
VNDKSGLDDPLFVLLITGIAIFGLAAVLRRGLAGAISLYIKYRLAMIAISSLLMVGFVAFVVVVIRSALKARRTRSEIARAETEGQFTVGIDPDGQPVAVSIFHRRMHCQVVGTTNAGKTESVIVPWAVEDIRSGRGFIIIDGKADKPFIQKILGYAHKNGRQKDLRFFSLGHIDLSETFNPLVGGSADEITERVFSAFQWESEYYRDIQYNILAHVLRIFHAAQEVPTFLKLYQSLSNPVHLMNLVERVEEDSLVEWAEGYKTMSPDEREKRTSGLLAQISKFAFGDASPLFNTENPTIRLTQVLDEGLLVYFQLPAMKSRFLGEATGKLILQALQSAIADRHLRGGEHRFMSVFLDDVSEYLYPGFVTLLNKSRSANVGVVFAHQALGDVEQLGEAVANAIVTNTNLKIIMRGNEPRTAEFFSKVIGTKSAEKLTERKRKAWLADVKTGDGSVREVEEFDFHPNLFKRELGVGEAVMILPGWSGSAVTRVKFRRLRDLEPVPLMKVDKAPPKGFKTSLSVAPSGPRDAAATQVISVLKEKPKTPIEGGAA